MRYLYYLAISGACLSLALSLNTISPARADPGAEANWDKVLKDLGPLEPSGLLEVTNIFDLSNLAQGDLNKCISPNQSGDITSCLLSNDPGIRKSAQAFKNQWDGPVRVFYLAHKIEIQETGVPDARLLAEEVINQTPDGLSAAFTCAKSGKKINYFANNLIVPLPSSSLNELCAGERDKLVFVY